MCVVLTEFSLGKTSGKHMVHHAGVVNGSWTDNIECISLSGRGVKADHALPSSERVKNERKYTADHPYCFMACKGALHIYLIASSFHGFDNGQRDTPASLKDCVLMHEVQQLLTLRIPD